MYLTLLRGQQSRTMNTEPESADELPVGNIGLCSQTMEGSEMCGGDDIAD